MSDNKFEQVYEEMLPFWNKISQKERALICDNSYSVTYSSGTGVHDSSECSGVFFIRSGCLRVYMLSEEGKEITLYRLYAGDLCMLSASCVLQTITFDIFIDAQEDSECFIITGPAFAELSDNNPEIKIFSLETAISRFSDVMWVMQQILFMSMDKRLAIFLWDEASRLGRDTIPLTHEQIAKYMGSAREVVSRMLKYFSNERIIETSRKGVRIIDKNKLRKFIQ